MHAAIAGELLRAAAHALSAGVPGLLLAALLACGAPSQIRYEEGLVGAPPSRQHALHSVRLQALMRSMNRLVQERLPRSMDVRSARTLEADEIARVAAAVAATAEEIPRAASPAALDDAERPEFLKLGQSLADQAQGLADDAAWLDPEGVRARLDAMQATCSACHTRFGIQGAPGGVD